MGNVGDQLGFHVAAAHFLFHRPGEAPLYLVHLVPQLIEQPHLPFQRLGEVAVGHPGRAVQQGVVADLEFAEIAPQQKKQHHAVNNGPGDAKKPGAAEQHHQHAVEQQNAEQIGLQGLVQIDGQQLAHQAVAALQSARHHPHTEAAAAQIPAKAVPHPHAQAGSGLEQKKKSAPNRRSHQPQRQHLAGADVQ